MPRSKLRITALDFGELELGGTLETAKLAESLGFSRFWIAEHLPPYCDNALLWTALVAGVTDSIRVGPAGVLVRYQSAGLIARTGIFLEGTFERIDLGLAGGRHEPPLDAPYLDGRANTEGPEVLELKLQAIADEISRYEDTERRPETWILGTSDNERRGRSAAQLHAHFCLSLMHGERLPSRLPLDAYRDEEARQQLAPGYSSIALQLACVATDADKRPTPFSVKGSAFVERPRLCREHIEAMADEYGVEAE